MQVEVPSNWTEADLLKALASAEKTNTREPKTEHNCYNCGLWHQTGKHEWQGYCGISSGNCATSILNHESPPRWINREEMKR